MASPIRLPDFQFNKCFPLKHLLFSCLLTVMMSCTPETKDIQYGKDRCANCVMTIVDQRFGCEIVTDKAKVYKFDAVECMVQYIHQQQWSDESLAMIVTNTYDAPAKLKSVDECVFLQSQKMPSPMGRYLNPFSDFEEAASYQQLNGGEIYQWEPLKILLAQ